MFPIDLADIKAAFIDFDDTAVIHLIQGEWNNWFKECFTGNDKAYTIGERVAPMPGMKQFLDILAFNTIPIYCLTQANSSIVVVPKKKVLDTLYGEDMFNDVIAVCSRDFKVVMLQRFCTEFGFEPKEILVVDDNPHIRDQAVEAGFRYMSPQEVAYRYGG